MRCLSPCPDAQGHQKVPAIQSEQEDLPIHISTLRIGNITSGIHQAAKTRHSLVKAARCQSSCTSTWTGPAAFQDDHHAIPDARMGHQFREV